MSNITAGTDFDIKLKQYEQMIQAIEQNQSSLTEEHVLDLLMARDDLQQMMTDKTQKTGENITSLSALDGQLRTLGSTIAKNTDLDNLRKTLNRSEESWWWAFKPPVQGWDRYDWVWNTLTAAALALAASFMVNIYSAFATGNATVATALSAIVQATGLAIIGRGALTVDGRKRVSEILATLNVPPRFQAEVTCLLAILLFGAVYYTNHTLDDAFLERGTASYMEGSLHEAGLAFRQGLDIKPEEESFHHNLGRVYESLGKLDQAYDEYLISSEAGDPESLNNLGRVVINRPDPATKEADPSLAEAYLLLGLQRASTNEGNHELHYELNRNIGWALIQQEEYSDAQAFLQTALDRLAQTDREGGMGNCFLAYAQEQEGQQAEAIDNWKQCIRYGEPSYIHEFQWLVDVGRSDVAYCLNSEHVVAGYDGKRTADDEAWCNGLEFK